MIEIILCLVPPTARDELTHHLAIPQLYVRAGRIIEVPMAPYSYFPMLLDMLYTPWIYWGYDSVPKLIHGLFGFLTGIGENEEASFDPRLGLCRMLTRACLPSPGWT